MPCTNLASLEHIYFPLDVIVSLIYVTEDGWSAEIAVLDRPQLEGRVCECYAVVKEEYVRLLPGGPDVR